jgi:hypothetical protein
MNAYTQWEQIEEVATEYAMIGWDKTGTREGAKACVSDRFMSEGLNARIMALDVCDEIIDEVSNA